MSDVLRSGDQKVLDTVCGEARGNGIGECCVGLRFCEAFLDCMCDDACERRLRAVTRLVRRGYVRLDFPDSGGPDMFLYPEAKGWANWTGWQDSFLLDIYSDEFGQQWPGTVEELARVTGKTFPPELLDRLKCDDLIS
jgi:hypothetical protein